MLLAAFAFLPPACLSKSREAGRWGLRWGMWVRVVGYGQHMPSYSNSLHTYQTCLEAGFVSKKKKEKFGLHTSSWFSPNMVCMDWCVCVCVCVCVSVCARACVWGGGGACLAVCGGVCPVGRE